MKKNKWKFLGILVATLCLSGSVFGADAATPEARDAAEALRYFSPQQVVVFAQSVTERDFPNVKAGTNLFDNVVVRVMWSYYNEQFNKIKNGASSTLINKVGNKEAEIAISNALKELDSRYGGSLDSGVLDDKDIDQFKNELGSLHEKKLKPWINKVVPQQ